MRITVNRITQTENTTISSVSIDGTFECFGLENPANYPKIMGDTRIPAGLYNVRLRAYGGKHETYKEKFSSIHDGMLEIEDVPNFKHVLIHIGNYHEDTDGCLLLGVSVNHVAKTESDYMVGSSTDAYSRFYLKVVQAAKQGYLSILVCDESVPMSSGC